MVEHPIIFWAPFIPRVLDGSKPMTRRVMRQPEFLQVYDYKGRRIYDASHRSWCWKGKAHGRYPDEYIPSLAAMCPYGQPGDLLYVKETFHEKTGHEPQDDDLERVNCPHVGETGHWQCGWCQTHDKPRFMCGCLVMEAK